MVLHGSNVSRESKRVCPVAGFTKINMDASRYLRQRGVGTPRVARDEHGIVLGAFLRRYSGDISVNTTELLAVRDAIRFSVACRFQGSVVERNVVNVVNISIKNKRAFPLVMVKLC